MSNTKLKHKAISLETKIEILDRLRNGEGSTFLGKTFGLNEATIVTIKKKEISIRQSVISGTKLSVKSSSYTRDATKEKMEKALIIWLEDNAQKQIPVDGNNIKQQALRFYKMIKDEQPSTSIQSTHEKSYVFSASTAHAVGGEGFDDLVFDDIAELMIDKVLSEEEILHFASQNADSIESSDSEEPVKLTANLIQEGLQLANKLGHHFITNDPNVERAAQFQRELNSCMARYKELYKEVARIGEQRLITEFIVKNVDAERARESPVQNYSSDDSDCIAFEASKCE